MSGWGTFAWSRNFETKMASSSENFSDQEKALEYVKSLIRPFPDFPQPGILFRDICPVLKDCNALRTVTDLITEHLQANFSEIDAIVGLDARGFLFGPLVSMNLGTAFIPIRKSGKLPGPTIQVSSTKEYGKDTLEMQADAIEKGQKVVVLDDLLATGGTLQAACQLVEKAGAVVLGCIVLVELEDLKGKDKLPVACHSLVKF
ncbi:adenine phosphoribosyltransferase-like [Montipora capricornis]|uniref:adenine phosphoribosyltransferase-like n=1 Tax=Montipora capricornis TaxID=246305 RepID=UPI0035F0FE87